MTDEGVARRTPLAHRADRLAAASGGGSGGAVSLAEAPRLTQIDLRVDPKGPAADAVGLALGCPLPLEPNTIQRSGELAVWWLGPDEWLVVGPDGRAAELAATLRTAVGAEPASIVDVSAQRTTIVVGGARSRDLLAHGCALDLHLRAFGEGRCAQTLLARAHVLLGCLGQGVFWVMVQASYAEYVAEWLLDAATEYLPR